MMLPTMFLLGYPNRIGVRITRKAKAAGDCKSLVDTRGGEEQDFGHWRNTEQQMNEAFQALSDPTRREILRLLRKGDMTAGEISEQFDLAKSTLSGHFSVLRHAGLIVAEKSGTTITYSLNTSVVESLLGSVMDLLGTDTKKSHKSSKKS